MKLILKYAKYFLVFLGWLCLGIMMIVLGTLILNVVGQFLFSHIPFIADISSKGALGDAINGLSAPLITFMSAILVYYTFRAQNKANELLASQWKFDTYNKLFADIEERFYKQQKELAVNRPDEKRPYFAEIVNTVSSEDKSDQITANQLLTPLNFLLEDFEHLQERLMQERSADTNFYWRKIKRFYDELLRNPLARIEKGIPEPNLGIYSYESYRVFLTLKYSIEINFDRQQEKFDKIWKKSAAKMFKRELRKIKYSSEDTSSKLK